MFCESTQFGTAILPLMFSRHFPIKLSTSACSNDVFARMPWLGLAVSSFTSHNARSSSTVTLNLSHASSTNSWAILLCKVLVNSFAYFLKFNIRPFSTLVLIFFVLFSYAAHVSQRLCRRALCRATESLRYCDECNYIFPSLTFSFSFILFTQTITILDSSSYGVIAFNKLIN